MPVGAFGGRADIMDYLAPLGPVYQAGTLSGNPLAMAAGIAALEALGITAQPAPRRASRAKASPYELLEKLGAQLETGMVAAARTAKVPVQFNRIGSMFCAYFTNHPVHNLADAMRSDRERFRKVLPCHARAGNLPRAVAVRSGVHFGGPHAGGIERTVRAARKAMQRCK